MSFFDENIPGEWVSKSLGSMGDFFGGVTSITKQDYGHGTPFLPFKNVFNNSKVDISALELMNVKEKDLKKRNCSYGDIFFTASSETDDEVAMSSVLLDNVKNLTYNGFCKRYRLHSLNELNPKFARYFFRSRIFRGLIKQVVTGDVRFNISQETLSNVKISIPKNIEEQKAIAKVLTVFDDKIELLQAQNKTLESMAQTIFKEWFGKYQIGDELPEGWRVGEFGELFNLTMGLSPKGDSYNFDMIGVPLLNGAGDYTGEKLDPKRYTSKPTRINKVGDLVFCIRGTIGKIVFADKEYCLGRGVAALSPKESNDKYFNYIKLKRIVDELTRNATGSVILGLSKDDIKKARLILPSRTKLDEFSGVVKPIFDKIEINQNQIQSLNKTRDTLLPKLMSGQVRVNNPKQTTNA